MTKFSIPTALDSCKLQLALREAYIETLEEFLDELYLFLDRTYNCTCTRAKDGSPEQCDPCRFKEYIADYLDDAEGGNE